MSVLIELKKHIWYNNLTKLFTFNLIVSINIFIIKEYINNQQFKLKSNFFKVQTYLNIQFDNKLNNKIRIGLFTHGLKYGGIQRMSALLLNYFDKTKIFNLFLFSQKNKEKNEYLIPDDIKRIFIPNSKFNTMYKEIIKRKIDILIFQFPYDYAINSLNNIKQIKTIFFQHYSLFYWIYKNYNFFKSLYREYRHSKYVINLVPFENNYIFRKWGIRSILMNNFITYEYNYIIPSDFSKKAILMIGRSHDKYKRLELGLLAMEYIRNEKPDYKMVIISNVTNNNVLRNSVKDLNIEKYVKFVGYTTTPEIYYRKSILHIFPTISESFGLVLSEAKIYGIPTILVGLDYVSISKGGTFIIFDDKPETIAIESIQILEEEKYLKSLSKEARSSMKKFNNEMLLKKWVKLIICIYNGDKYYEEHRKIDKKISKIFLLKTLNNQLKLLKMRNKIFESINIEKFENFSYLENIKIN